MQLPLGTALIAAVLCLALARDDQIDATETSFARLETALFAIDRALGYMESHLDGVNLDGVIGIRIVEGQFGAFLTLYWTRLPMRLVTLLKSTQLAAARIADRATKFVRIQTPEYFANAAYAISRHNWDTFYPSKHILIAPDTDAAPSGDDLLDEKFSDDCAKTFSGRENAPRCQISQACWDKMAASEGHWGYFLTHQVLFLMTGIQLNCLENLTRLAELIPQLGRHTDAPLNEPPSQPLLSLLDRRCGRVFTEALELEKRHFPVQKRDLFMEQIALCGLAGYTEFAKRRWFDRVIAWQSRDTGCYGYFPGETDPTSLATTAAGDEYGYQRRRRTEALMGSPGDGCLSHRTSVALGALVVFVRRELVESMA